VATFGRGLPKGPGRLPHRGSRPSPGHVDDGRARQRLEAVGRDGEDRLGRAGRRPDGLEGRERLVEVDGDVGLVEERGHATDRPPERLLHLVGLGHPDHVGVDAPQLGQGRLVDAVRAARDDHDQLVGHHGDRAGDLGHVTADDGRGVGGGLCALWELVDVDLEVEFGGGPLGEIGSTLVHGGGCRPRAHNPSVPAIGSGKEPAPVAPTMTAHDRWLYAWGLGYVAVGGASLLVPVYALTLGATAFDVGLLAATAAFAGAPGALLAGRLAERTGRRRPFVLLALLGGAAVLVGMTVVRTSLGLLVLNVGLWFVVAGAAPVCNLVMVEGASADDWDDRLARLNAVQGYGWVLGLVLGIGWLAVPRPGGPAVAQRTLLLALAGVALAAGAGVGVLFPERATTRRLGRRLARRFARLGRRDLGAGRVIRLNPLGPGRLYWSLRGLDPTDVRRTIGKPSGLFLGGTALVAVGSAVFWGPMPAYLDAKGLSTAAIFAVFLTANLGSAVTYGRVAAIEPRVGAARLQLGAVASRVVLFPGTAIVAGGVVAVLAVFFLFVGISWALIAVTAPLLVTRLASAGRQAGALALYTAVMSAGTGIGSVLGGGLATWTGYVPAFSTAGGTVLVGALLAWRGLVERGDAG